MVRTYTSEVSGVQLVTGVLGTVDIANMVKAAWQIKDDVAQALKEKESLYSMNDLMSEAYPSKWREMYKKSPSELLALAKSNYKAQMNYVWEMLATQASYSSIGWGMSATLIGQRIKEYMQLWGVSTWHDALMGFPAQMIQEKLERYFRKDAAPSLPSDRDAFKMYRLGKWTSTQYLDRIRETEGLSLTDAVSVADMREWEVGKPSLRDAWFMVQKNIKPLSFFYDLAKKAHGFTQTDAEAMNAFFTYDPSPMEMMRLSDLIPLESTWVDKKLTGVGLDDTDKAIYKAALEKRQIRDEINKAWSLLLDCYQWGLFTTTDIETFLDRGKFSETEKDWRIEVSDLLRLKLRVKLLRDAEIYLYRKDQLTEDELLLRLTNLTISKDIANAIVRNEAAKKGVDWEIPE